MQYASYGTPALALTAWSIHGLTIKWIVPHFSLTRFTQLQAPHPLQLFWRKSINIKVKQFKYTASSKTSTVLPFHFFLNLAFTSSCSCEVWTHCINFHRHLRIHEHTFTTAKCPCTGNCNRPKWGWPRISQGIVRKVDICDMPMISTLHILMLRFLSFCYDTSEYAMERGSQPQNLDSPG